MADQDFEITIRFSRQLEAYNDQHLAALWHVTQANPAEFGNEDAGRAAELVGREIIRRFLATTPPELWVHQGAHAPFENLQRLKERLNGGGSSESQEARHG